MPSPPILSHRLLDRLGSFYEITNIAIKTYSVGYPIQAALDALLTIVNRHGLAAGDVKRLVARMPEDGARIVDNREMPNINVQHALAMALVDGGVTFESIHSSERMKDLSLIHISEPTRPY